MADKSKQSTHQGATSSTPKEIPLFGHPDSPYEEIFYLRDAVSFYRREEQRNVIRSQYLSTELDATREYERMRYGFVLAYNVSECRSRHDELLTVSPQTLNQTSLAKDDPNDWKLVAEFILNDFLEKFDKVTVPHPFTRSEVENIVKWMLERVAPKPDA